MLHETGELRDVGLDKAAEAGERRVRDVDANDFAITALERNCLRRHDRDGCSEAEDWCSKDWWVYIGWIQSKRSIRRAVVRYELHLDVEGENLLEVEGRVEWREVPGMSAIKTVFRDSKRKSYLG